MPQVIVYQFGYKCKHFTMVLWSTINTMIDVAAGGILIGKTPEATYELLKEIAFNNY